MVVSMEPMIMIPEGQGAGGYREHDIMVEDSAYDITIDTIYSASKEYGGLNGPDR